MVRCIEAHRADEPGYIVAWRHKKAFKAGKYRDEVMAYAEAIKKAEQPSAQSKDIVYRAEALPE